MAEREVQAALKPMMRRGLVWGYFHEGTRHYRMAPLIVGFYEAQLETMNHTLAHLVEEYMAQGGAAGIMRPQPAHQRVVPARGTVKTEWILPYDDVKALLQNAKTFRIRDCICRVQQRMVGKGCDAPIHNCLSFSDATLPATPNDVTLEQALALLDEAEAAALVHSVSNVAQGVSYVCNCCGCCCGILRGITEWNSPAAVSSAVLCLLLGLTFWLAGRRRKMRPSVAALIIAAGAGIAAVRNLPFAAVAAIWAIGDHLELPAQWPRGLGWMKRFDISIANVGGWLSAIAVPGVLLVLAVLPGRTGPYPLDLSRYPVAALEAVRRENPPGNIFVREEWSGYLLWMMPERRLFHDAKGGFSREASEAHRLLAVPLEGWRTVAERYDIGTFLLHRGTAPVTVLEEAPDWRLLYTDSLAVAYVRVASGESRVPNRDLLEFGTIHRNPKPAARRRGELCVSQEALPSGHAPVLARRSVPGSVP